MITCKLCSKEFENDGCFHKHLRAHKLTQTEYYQKYYPRYDSYDKTIIRFKNKEYYFTTNFNSRSNLKRWLNSVEPEVAKTYVKKFLNERKERKNLIYAPTQVELKTLMIPGIKFIDDNLGGYDALCQSLGFKKRFSLKKLNESLFKDITNKIIFRDSREQLPLEFNNKTRTEGLAYGDYRMSGCDIVIERKSLSDFWGTLTGGYERFEKEIIRAKEDNAYLVILVENAFNELEKFPLQRQVWGKIKIPVEFILHNIRELSQKYTNIQFLFTQDRNEASRLVEKIFSVGEQIKDIDLQYYLDIGKL